MANPFNLKVIKNESDFCDRIPELEKLTSYIESKTNAVLYAPRRYGKTSLVKRLHNSLPKEKYILIYIDYFGVTSLEDISMRTAKSVYDSIKSRDHLLKKAIETFKSFRPVMRPTETGVSISVEHATPTITGLDLLNRTFQDLGEFIAKTTTPVNVVFDEFQEIEELKELQIEGVLRSHIQEQECSFFFLGSRRRTLLNMFNDKKRPFFQSAFLFELKKLPFEDLSLFLKERFENNGKTCSTEMANHIVHISQHHPYYSQKLGYCIYEQTSEVVTEKEIALGLEELVESERVLFETLLQGLSLQQIALIKAIARQPSGSLMSTDYIKLHNLKSIGGIQGATKKLTDLDLIEKKDNVWQVVDPIFEAWLKE